MKLVALLSLALVEMSVASAADDSWIQVQALDCEFTIPGDYVVQAQSEGTEFYSRSDTGYGRISLRSLTDREAEPAAKQLGAEASGHLKIIRYACPLETSEYRTSAIQLFEAFQISWYSLQKLRSSCRMLCRGALLRSLRTSSKLRNVAMKDAR